MRTPKMQRWQNTKIQWGKFIYVCVCKFRANSFISGWWEKRGGGTQNYCSQKFWYQKNHRDIGFQTFKRFSPSNGFFVSTVSLIPLHFFTTDISGCEWRFPIFVPTVSLHPFLYHTRKISNCLTVAFMSAKQNCIVWPQRVSLFCFINCSSSLYALRCELITTLK